MRLWVGIVLAGTLLFVVAAPFSAMAAASERDPADEPGGRRGPGDAERVDERVADWRIVDQPVTRWQGRGLDDGTAGERLATGRTADGGQAAPVLPLGAGLTCLGAGLGLLGLRLRQT
ncbi:hypothetical protein [Streptomyces profundus]|uniref:hypothetical protein n=1 Tax=Streptomyces profundus TaxID=2867410 RepID=UPI001D168D49|nr:hypothetical protein [Streptomyces sp. MA3_2.13]UED85430.1 hypothetical protein K4G22_15490 [Streptomyces sp. MA3_2.13]